MTKFMVFDPTFVHGMLFLTVRSLRKNLKFDMMTLHDQIMVK